MDTPPKLVLDVEKIVGGTPKEVLLVEGADDLIVVERWLSLRDPNFRQNLHVHDAAGWEKLRNALKWRPDWMGLQDRDEWTEAEIADAATQYPGLRFLPRPCIENYFVVPSELWALIPAPQQANYPGNSAQFASDISAHSDRYTRHWCMWVVLRVRRRVLIERLQFPDALIERMLDAAPLTEAEVQSQLQQWHDVLNAKDVFQEYQDLEKQSLVLSPEEKLKQHVHGKSFFTRVIAGEALRTIAQKSHQDWFKDLAANIASVPDDVITTLESILH
jgi:hypothetical protein